MQQFPKPAPGDYPTYANAYISRTPATGLTPDQLRDNFATLEELIEPLNEEQLLLRYQPGKWTIKEVLTHLIDAERIMAYRLLRVARHDTTPLPGYEHDDYIAYSFANKRSKASILAEYRSVRAATLTLLESLDERVAGYAGTASNHRITVTALAHFIAGHELHHLAILRERYWPLL